MSSINFLLYSGISVDCCDELLCSLITNCVMDISIKKKEKCPTLKPIVNLWCVSPSSKRRTKA